MNLVRAVVLTVAIVALLAGAGIFWLTTTGMSARSKPGGMESGLAEKVRDWSVPKEVRHLQNPVANTPENLAQARMHFADHCAICHGNDGRGGVEMGRNMYPQAPDMTLAATQNKTDGELYYIIENGVRFTGMPAWGAGGLNDQDTWKLVLYVRHLPQVTRQELLEMENNNPRSPMDMKEEQQENEFLNGPSK